MFKEVVDPGNNVELLQCDIKNTCEGIVLGFHPSSYPFSKNLCLFGEDWEDL
jgi:hypothetical protein